MRVRESDPSAMLGLIALLTVFVFGLILGFIGGMSL